MFCPKCGAIMLPSKDEKGNRIIKCGCGHISKVAHTTLKESVKHVRALEVVDKEIETLPVTKENCPKCGNGEAYYWLRQTRAGDEPETKFMRCTKCKHTWRDYS
ncbi:MAG: transcription factor S [Nanoarchaeota archaeon]|nr:transcription factor S [Nanoarchaeota archaeon]